ncbi:hypothetical protein DHEL01_v212807 [Diaporthe helianthi]|uniref:Rhodopsin domain-containing protein n=1 Tax=Diaporthe helianthi TaxID=158607 RepID=A0A2P5HEZ3_DIAHE|nr:hypothetical protein DHEL01_v212807 [Diaporthe helianthi]
MAYSPIIETRALYGSGSLLIFSRSLCRWRMVGFRGFDFDDYFIWFSWAIYTVMTYAADVCDRHADLHTLTLAQRETMTMDEAAPYIWVTVFCRRGNLCRLRLVAEDKHAVLFPTSCQGALGREAHLALVLCTFIMIMGILFGACRPSPRMWKFYTDEGVLIMNIITDLCIMAIPAPVVLRAKMNLWKKVSLVLLFSGGFFIMIAAILHQKDGSTAAICRLFWTSRGKMTTGQSSTMRPSKPGSMPINDSSNDAFEMRKG